MFVFPAIYIMSFLAQGMIMGVFECSTNKKLIANFSITVSYNRISTFKYKPNVAEDFKATALSLPTLIVTSSLCMNTN
jgi:hypothetical protein